MTVDKGQVLLVGSVARPEDGWDVEGVFRNCATALGDRVSMLPDGELGDRHYWVNYIPRHTYLGHPDMVKLSRHTFEDWKPASYDDHWLFSIREGVESLQFERLGYAEEAKRSYAVFKELRDAGVIPAGTRFMVALPQIESATRRFIDAPRHFEILWQAYGEVLRREVRELVDAIPSEDLAIQWDMVVEVAAVEGRVDYTGDLGTGELTRLPEDPMERYREALRWTSRDIPPEVWLGLHICYGSLNHRSGESSDSGHFGHIEDLKTSVAMANEGARAVERPVHFVHHSVQLSNGFDDAYYAPLRQLDVGDARTYLGLVHLHDGVEGALRRIEIARRHLPDFGIATQCGWGRRPPEHDIGDLLALERAVADAAG